MLSKTFSIASLLHKENLTLWTFGVLALLRICRALVETASLIVTACVKTEGAQ